MNYKSSFVAFVCLLCVSGSAMASGEIKQVPFTDVQVKDLFWKQRLDVMRNTTIRYAFQKVSDAGQIRNFEYAGKIVSGEAQVGDLTFQSGNPYDDAEVYKVLEGASYVLTTQADASLEAYCDDVIDKICSAQEPDGYLQTNFTTEAAHSERRFGRHRTSYRDCFKAYQRQVRADSSRDLRAEILLRKTGE